MQTLAEFPFPTALDYEADTDITAAIELLLLTKPGVAAHLFDVSTQAGIVVLTGFVDNLLAGQRAEEIALAVRGVRGVVNELLIRATDLPDADLLRDVTLALAADPATADYNVQATVAEGVVTLTGVVQSWAERELVRRVVRGVRAVRRLVDHELLIRWDEIQNSDDEISTQIRELLDWDIRVYGALVTVQTTDRVVHLAGTVGTAAEKSQIVATAYAAGATRVDSQELAVEFWALSSVLRRDKFAPRADADVARAVRDTCRLDPRVPTAPLVRVLRGATTLSGLVPSLRAKQAAEQDARNVVGVWDVHNLLKVRTRQLETDAVVQQSIRTALARNPYLGAFDFCVQVFDGKAYLYGLVNNHFEQDQAADVAAGATGVVAVENRVGVPHAGGLGGAPAFGRTAAALHLAAGPDPDRALAERIRTHLYWSASLHEQDLQVRVDHGRATLVGTVDTWLDRKQAALEAYEAGARDVNNHLRVRTEAAATEQLLTDELAGR
jgi:osmotically-inducible protein OsmY